MSVPASARRGPPPLLQRDDLIRAALDLLDRTGAAGFSMRALAGSLNVAPMTVYNYFASRDELFAATIDSVIDTVEPPDPAAADWRAELRRYSLDVWHSQVPHPWLPTLLAHEHIVDRPAQQRARTALLELFRGAGAGSSAARDAVGFYFAFMIGTFVQAAGRLRVDRLATRPEALFRAGLEMLTAGIETRLAATPVPKAPL